MKALDGSAREFDEKQFVQSVIEFKPDVLVVEIPHIVFPLMLPILKEIKSTVNCVIGIAGLFGTAYPERVLTEYDCADFVLIGEWEATLAAIVDSDDPNYDGIGGVAYKVDRKIIVNNERKLASLAELPFPDRDDLPVGMYRDFEIAGSPVVQMLATRGCPYRCGFCYITVLYNKPSYRKRDLDDVVDEMELCHDKYKAKQIYFDDDTIGVDKGFLRDLAKKIRSRKVDIPWSFMGDITIDSKTLEELRKSGLIGLKFGVETFNGASLEIASKRFVNKDKVWDFVATCKKMNIWTHATYQVGLPGETTESIRRTIQYAKELDTDSLQISISTPLPGSPFYENARINGWLTTDDLSMYDGSRYAVVSYPSLSASDIQSLYEEFNSMWEKHLARRYLKHPISIHKRASAIGYRPSMRDIIRVVRKSI